jgi:methionyl-tRNA formyltransferase
MLADAIAQTDGERSRTVTRMATAGASPTQHEARLRILFITEDDPLYVIEFFDAFLEAYPRERLEVAGITVSRAFNESRPATARRVLRLYGAVDFAKLAARYARAKLRGRSIESLARRASIELLPTASVNDPAYIRRVRDLAPDVIVSVAAPEIFGEELLESPGMGCVNIHSGRLPTYRGMMPVFWQMLNSEPSVTVTVHEMAAQLDAGAVLGTVELPILPSDRLSRLMVEGKVEGARLLIRVLEELARGAARPTPLDLEQASYFSFPGPAEARELRALGHTLV